MRRSKRDDVKMNKKIKKYLSIFPILLGGFYSKSAFAFDATKWQVRGAGSFFFENHSVPTSKREQTDIDFNEFHFSAVVPLQADISLSFHPELTRTNRNMTATKNDDFQPRFRSAAMNRRIAGTNLTISAGLIDANLNAVYFDQYQSKRWMSSQLRPLIERYRLLSDSDLGMRMAYQMEDLSIDVSYTNGEGQGAEAGLRKSTQVRLDWKPSRLFQVGGFYLTGGDETYANEIFKIEVYEVNLKAEYELFSMSGSFVKTFHPADRLTTNKSWSIINLLAYANKSVRGNAIDIELEYELGRLTPFYQFSQANPVENNSEYSFLQHFVGIAYDLGPNENLGFYNYRILFNERHSLQSKEQDGMGISYALFF
jgi:hypothetical protein